MVQPQGGCPQQLELATIPQTLSSPSCPHAPPGGGIWWRERELEATTLDVVSLKTILFFFFFTRQYDPMVEK